MVASERATAAGTWVGTAVRRLEDPHLLAGRGRYVDDIRPPDTLHAAVVRSTQAFARIAGIDIASALAMPGVECVVTGRDLAGVPGLVPRLNRPEFTVTEMPLLATEAVRHVGEPVAIVLADTPHAAEDAAEAVEVEYESLTPVTSIDEALAPGAPAVHAEAAGNVLLDVAPHDTPGLDEALASAHLVVEATFTSGRLNASPLEGRACLAEWDDREGRLVLQTSTQVPHLVRLAVAELLGLRENQVRVVSPDVGGGFGQKCVIGREEMALAAVARRLGRPLKWVEDRQENLVAGFHGHEQRYSVRAGFDAEGHLLGLDADVLCDIGAYSCFPFTCGIEPLMAAAEFPGVYKLPRYRVRGRAVVTNKSPMAPYRGVSRPQIVLVMERLMKKAAIALGISEVEIRRRNLILDHEFPFTGVTGLVYDRGSYLESLERCAELLDAEGWPEKQAAARERGRLIGLGFACFSERSAYGTEAFAQRKMGITPGYENAHVRMDGSGGVIVSTGTHSHGQGQQTSFAQIVADELGVEPSRVLVRLGDTDQTPPGWGTFASRSIGIGGAAVKLAAERVADRLKAIAAHLLEAAPADIEVRDGRLSVRGTPAAGMTVAEVARIAHQQSQRLPPGERVLEATATFDPPGTFSNATHGVVVEVDAETGAVRILRYVVVEDCGVMINPMIVEGQVRGGIAQGIGAALYERIVYDEDGQPLTASLMDYLVPTASEIPSIEIHHLETPSAFTETGAKGMGEGGLIGAPATIANAVSDALAHLGFEADAIPIVPEGLLRAMNRAMEFGSGR